jgi:(2R)-ethylmalonyl-CoA mutase
MSEEQAAPETSVPEQAPERERPEKDRPWVMRTYAGHSSASESNKLYRMNLAKGQTGLSVAFDLPTQTGYDPDSPLARGEVGKVGVPIPHLGEMRRLFEDIPLTGMNTSMTINATAMWLLALYQVVAEEQNGLTAESSEEDRLAIAHQLAGTTQNDIIKEYLSRGTYAFPPEHSMRLIADVISYTVNEIPKWNPINICSYHLQEAGATPTQELAYALCTAIAVLDAVRDSGQVAEADFPKVVGRISFFVNAGVRFIEETCKMRAFVRLWDEITRERYGVEDDKMRRFRYGVQVNSLGLTEAQPENNVQRIVLEMLGVTLSKDARARAVQLPAWNEALGLPRPWDQQWSLRLQQVLAFESDLLEYDDIFEGSHVIEAKVAQLAEDARAEIDRVQALGGAIAAVESGYMKQALVSSHATRRARIENGEDIVVGVNRFETTEVSPLTADLDAAIQAADPEAERSALAGLEEWRAQRDQGAVDQALEDLAAAAKTETNLMTATLAAARAGATTGEWAGALREVFGEFRAPTGVSGAVGAGQQVGEAGKELAEVREQVRRTGEELGGRLRLLVGKPGLDGHSNGAEQVAVRARDAGFEVIYQGIRLTPDQIVAAAVAEDVHCVGLSILSGSHMELVPDVLDKMVEAGIDDVPVIVGGIIPDRDARALKELGVAAVFTPKDFSLTQAMAGIVRAIREANHLD